MTPRSISLVLAIALALTGGVGCGGDDDDDGGGGGGKTNAAKPKPKAPVAAKAKGQEVISFIPTLESTVPEDERTSIRRRLRDRDFAADPTGVENRDPFRSFVMPQAGIGLLGQPAGPTVEPTETCTKKKMVASGHSINELTLIGIVLRGTQRNAKRYALFRDSRGNGHIVERDQCLGKEKARVKDIAEGLVTLELTPDQVPGLPPKPPEEKSIPLYPNELPIADQFDDDEEAPPPPSAPPVAPMGPPVPPPPGAKADGS
ncbi:MAG: hypothetical protein H6709_19220 [Kofleriaceae bacterium]|nr:hypothetical protein [Myxococcales bacterium]MCB9561352.1 hypothetical protein [Kofleriaceae bacterium]MCB9574222.1 hypothetical protein [Kofleriaceae bacterium]